VKQPSAGKQLVACLTLSAAGLIGIVTRESYTDTAVIPTKGDVPTVGFGSTKQADGAPVKIGDTTDPVRALHTVQAHLSREEVQFRDSLPGVKLTQGEYDLYVDFAYQYGITNWRASSMRRNLLTGDYEAACDALLAWRKAAGYDCSTLVNGQPNKRCWGVWTRQQERHAKCIAEQTQ
jgi:lysozyme